MNDSPNRTNHLTRRDALRLGLLGVAGAAGVVALGWPDDAGAATSRASTAKKRTASKSTASKSTAQKSTAQNGTTKTATTLLTASAGTACTLTPEMTEGPYYLDINKVRSDVTEGRPGSPLALTLTIANAASCAPIAGAAVDIWHTDALGNYSGVQGASGSFMRGTQVTDANGVVKFATVYPGWYQGRTVHIHVKVHAGGSVVHTGQLFFDDAITDGAYKAAPYNTRGARTTRNAQDNIYSGGGAASLLKPAAEGSGYTAAMTMGVHQ